MRGNRSGRSGHAAGVEHNCEEDQMGIEPRSLLLRGATEWTDCSAEKKGAAAGPPRL
jgi:hypothetical protein